MTEEACWFASYPEGAPHTIDPDAFPSLPAILDATAAKFPERVGYSNMGVGLTYARTVELTKSFAAYLQSLEGLEPGDRVAIMMPNLLQYVVAVYACLRAGFVIVNINPLYTTREVHHTLKDSGAKAIVIIENFAKTLEGALADTNCRHVVTTAVGDLFPFFKRTLVNFVVKNVKKMVSIRPSNGSRSTTPRMASAPANARSTACTRPISGYSVPIWSGTCATRCLSTRG